MPPLNDATGFFRHVEALNRHDPARYLPFMVAGAAAGLVRRDFCAALAAFPGEIGLAGAAVTLLAEGGLEGRSAALARVTEALGKAGGVRRRGELYPVVTGWGEPLLATIDRGAVQFFGTRAFGVHVNGIVQKADGPHLWIGRRAMDRSVSPGKLDNLIGGGLPAGLTALQTVVKEAEEEAGLDETTARGAVPVGIVSYIEDAPGGVKRDTLFAYDLYLPEGLIPQNRDGEVERFDLLPLGEVARLVRDTDEFKPNCNLVIIDLLIRHGRLTPDMPGYERLARGLRGCYPYRHCEQSEAIQG